MVPLMSSLAHSRGPLQGRDLDSDPEEFVLTSLLNTAVQLINGQSRHSEVEAVNAQCCTMCAEKNTHNNNTHSQRTFSV